MISLSLEFVDQHLGLRDDTTRVRVYSHIVTQLAASQVPHQFGDTPLWQLEFFAEYFQALVANIATYLEAKHCALYARLVTSEFPRFVEYVDFQ